MKLCPDRPWPTWFGVVNVLAFFGSPILVLFTAPLIGNWTLVPCFAVMFWACMNATS